MHVSGVSWIPCIAFAMRGVLLPRKGTVYNLLGIPTHYVYDSFLWYV